MSILADHQIRDLGIMTPCHDRTVFRGMSYGISSAGYDVRANIANTWDVKSNAPFLGTTMTPDGDGISLHPGQSILIGVIEHFTMPAEVVGIVHPKSTWTRRGILIANCVLEPGWKGFLTILVLNQGGEDVTIVTGEPIAQVIFHVMASSPENTYSGKYMDSAQGPQGPRFEE